MTERQQLIAAGVIKESDYVYRRFERPFMSSDCAASLRARLIRLGILVPGGLH